jgi:hypothetical protein
MVKAAFLAGAGAPSSVLAGSLLPQATTESARITTRIIARNFFMIDLLFQILIAGDDSAFTF